jgi:hypothetical protein
MHTNFSQTTARGRLIWEINAWEKVKLMADSGDPYWAIICITNFQLSFIYYFQMSYTDGRQVAFLH